MPKRISKVTFTSTPIEPTANNEQYLAEDIEALKVQGADNLAQVDIYYKEDPPVKGIVGIYRGNLMNNPSQWIALPCPPYCHPGPGGGVREQGELTFQKALKKINS